MEICVKPTVAEIDPNNTDEVRTGQEPVSQKGARPRRTDPPTNEEIADPTIIAWWYISDYAITHDLGPEILHVRAGEHGPYIIKHGCVSTFPLAHHHGHWEPIRVPAEWTYLPARSRAAQ